ncbi:hypothetical protein BaRGS_00018781, partial [Batillaria attramentaria]
NFGSHQQTSNACDTEGFVCVPTRCRKVIITRDKRPESSAPSLVCRILPLVLAVVEVLLGCRFLSGACGHMIGTDLLPRRTLPLNPALPLFSPSPFFLSSVLCSLLRFGSSACARVTGVEGAQAGWLSPCVVGIAVSGRARAYQ